jgi:chromosome segregation ATPase
MTKNQKGKAGKNSRSKRTTTKRKKTGGINVLEDAAMTEFDIFQCPEESVTNSFDDFADASEERVSIISTVKGLEGQVETVFKLNEILESQLNEAQRKLSEELSARIQSEVQATRRLEASEASKVAVERELAESIHDVQALRDEIEDLHAIEAKLREELTIADSRTSDLRKQLEDQQAHNRRLMETNTRLENEIKMVSINYEANRKELEAFKNAVRDIRSETTRTSGRVQEKFNLSKKKG